MPMADYFSSDIITPLEFFDEISSDSSDVARGLRQRCADFDGQAHLAPEREAIRRVASRF